MGNKTSKGQNDNTGAIISISGPQGGLQMVPSPERDKRGFPVRHPEFDISRSYLLAAFKHIAAYLRNHSVNITIVTVGGAVNTIYLRSRAVTHDVDFFGGNEQYQLLRDASHYAQEQSQTELGANWFNNTVTIFVPKALQIELVRDAVQQNVVLFHEQGLTVLAAPWSYALCGKTNRMGTPAERSYDCQNAVAYLRQYILSHGRNPVIAKDIEEWGRRHGKSVTTVSLIRINNMYKQPYGCDGITFQGPR